MQDPLAGTHEPDSAHVTSTSGNNGSSVQGSESIVQGRERSNGNDASEVLNPELSRDKSRTTSPPFPKKRKRKEDEIEVFYVKKLKNDDTQDCSSSSSAQTLREDTLEEEKQGLNQTTTESNVMQSLKTERNVCEDHGGDTISIQDLSMAGISANHKSRKKENLKATSSPMPLNAQIAQISNLMSGFANPTTSSPSNAGLLPPSRSNSRHRSSSNSQAPILPPKLTRSNPRQGRKKVPFLATYHSPFDHPTALDSLFVDPAFASANFVLRPPTQLQQGIQPSQAKVFQAQDLPQYQHPLYPINQMAPPHFSNEQPPAPHSNVPFTPGLPPDCTPGIYFLPHPSAFAASPHHVGQMNGNLPSPPPINQPTPQGHRSSIPCPTSTPPPVVHFGKPPPGEPSSTRNSSQSIEKNADVLMELFSSTRWLATFKCRYRYVEECRSCKRKRTEWDTTKEAYDTQISQLRSRVRELEAAVSASEAPTSLPTKSLTPPAVEPEPEPDKGVEAAVPDDMEASKLHALETEIAALQDRVKRQTTHISRLKVAAIERAALSETVKKLEKEKAELEEKNKWIFEGKNKSERKIVAHEATIKRTQPVVATPRGRADSAAGRVTEQNKRIGELEKKVESAVGDGRQGVEVG